jgi:hypothetical protein
VRVGEAAIVTPRGAVGDGLASHVTRVAPQVSELPLRCRRNPQLPEWGREVAVALDTHLPLLPGQAFSVSFLGHPSPHANTDAVPVAPASAPPPAPTPTPQLAAPRPPELPPALAARTRFEPSAIAWLPARDRFVIASDDTGFDKTHEHAPWLFTMDTRGRVDPEPLVVAGVPGFGDLEAVAAGPDGSLFVLASQSRSRKGKRPDSRQLFARVAIDADGARVLASTRLAAQLDAAGARFLATLGLHDTAELDLEGMTTTAAGGLLLGLKQPLDAAGRAPIWHLARPELLLAGDLAAAGLTPWGAVSSARPGRRRPAPRRHLRPPRAPGRHPPDRQHRLRRRPHHPGRHDLASPTAATASPPRAVLRSFPGLKPEGVALRPDGAALVVVFDTGAAPGLWMELPWPTP